MQSLGVVGHATIAYIAQNFVKDTTATWAQGVLGDTSTLYLANIASWADDYPWRAAAPYHFIDDPPNTCDVDYTRYCTKAGCSISGDVGRLTAEHTMEALMFLVHFIGDITQPLHDENLDVGGNTITVTFDGFDDDNLHKWATILTTGIKTGAYASEAASWIEGDDIDDAVGAASAWASDANAYVCTVVMPNGVAALQKCDLYPTYYDSVMPTIQLQFGKAGYRLANWLDQVADSNLGLIRRNNLREKRVPVASERDLIADLLEMGPPSMAQLAKSLGWKINKSLGRGAPETVFPGSL
ncbi:nuclease s1 [Mycena leptocephala]|nr:nuclease s1 [Mycena leptocephala]